MQKIFAFLSMYLVWFWQLLLPNVWTQESKKSNSSKEITDKIVKDMFEGISAAPLPDIPPVSVSLFQWNKFKILFIVENYYNTETVVQFVMFTLCKVGRKTHVHTLQWCFLKNSSNRRKVGTWVFLVTLQSVNMTNCSTVSVL